MHLATTALITFNYEMHVEHNYQKDTRCKRSPLLTATAA